MPTARLRVPLLLAGVLLLATCGGGGGGSGSPQPLLFTDFQPASVVVGQPDFAGQDPNQGGLPWNDTLSGPYGPSAEGSWYIPDWANNRVLGFTTLPTTIGAQAAFVLGQPDFASTAPATAADGLRSPGGLAIGGGRLAVADTHNHRVLIWSSLPTTNGAAPNVVVGQTDFIHHVDETTRRGLQYPLGVSLAGGRLFVLDSANHRVLIWNSVPTTNHANADLVLGQPDFTSGNEGPMPTGLNDPSGIWSDGVRLVVADGNHRVLIWNSIPTVDNTPADVVVGQPDLYTTMPTLGPQGLEFPQSVWATGAQLFVADTNHHRVLIYTPFPTANHAAATTVLGQSHFNHQRPNDDDQDGTADPTPSARTMRSPSGVSIIGNRLIVADRSNNRALIFDGL